MICLRRPLLLQRLLLAAIGASVFGVAQAQIGSRAIEDIDVVERAGYIDINLLFACTLRYLNHQPSSEGETLRIRTTPQRDCELGADGLTAPALPIASRELLLSIEVDRPVGSELDVTVRLRKSQRFLVLPNGDGRGLRLRILGASDRGGRVFIGADIAGPTASYAINLASSREAFSAATIAQAAQITGTRAYVSEYVLDQEKWYRLRIGPFATEADAKVSLLAARSSYPKAWLAIADDEKLTSVDYKEAATPALAPTAIGQATLTTQDIERVLVVAKTAFRRKDYGTAIPVLTQLLEQPEFPQRAEAQELMGLARERNRQIAHAKAEYEEYLRRYPSGAAVERVQQRLQALAWAARQSVRGLGGASEDKSAWQLYGGFAQLYRRDTSSIQSGSVTTDQVNQNALLNDFALIARRRGERFDFASRVSLGYAKNFLDNGLGDQTRVSTAFVELNDRLVHWRTRLGRQSATGTGILGNFDGIYGDYQWLPRVRIAVSAGSPVQSTRASFDSARQLVGLATNFGPYAGAWDISTFAILQEYQGETDRQAVGTEVHYFRPGRTLVGLIDYDLYYQELNNVLLLGTLALPARWTLSMNADRRNTPVLGVSNALIGQQSDSLNELLAAQTREEVDQLVRDRTAVSELYSVSVSRPIGERWQWTFDVASIAISGTPASGGVAAVPDSPRELVYSTLAIGNSVFTNGDLDVIALRYQASAAATTTSLGVSTRWPLWSRWRITPRIRVDKRELTATESTQLLYLPSLRVEYQRQRVWLELEGGREMGDTTGGDQTQKTTRTFFSAGYRINF